jgi:hypothetical protein
MSDDEMPHLDDDDLPPLEDQDGGGPPGLDGDGGDGLSGFDGKDEEDEEKFITSMGIDLGTTYSCVAVSCWLAIEGAIPRASHSLSSGDSDARTLKCNYRDLSRPWPLSCADRVAFSPLPL